MCLRLGILRLALNPLSHTSQGEGCSGSRNSLSKDPEAESILVFEEQRETVCLEYSEPEDQ